MAILPIAVLLVMMVVLSVGAVKAAPAGLLVSAISAVLVFRAGIPHVGLDVIKGIWSAVPILIVIWPAILTYEVVNESGAFRVFRNSMSGFTKNELLQIMLIGWVFPSFLQGITGFGVPGAVGAPLLISIGVTPFWAVVIPLLEATWGNTFGTLAAAWDALAIQGNLAEGSAEYYAAAMWACIYIWIWNIFAGLLLCWIYGRKEGLRKGLPAVIVLCLIQGGGQLLLSQFNTTLCCFIPTCAAIGAVVALGRTRWYRDEWRLEDSPIMERTAAYEVGSASANAFGSDFGVSGKAASGSGSGAPSGSAAEAASYPEDMNVAQAFMPYIVLTVITLAVLLIGPVKALLGQFRLGFPVPEMVTGYGYADPASEKFSPLAIFTHAGMFLLISAVFGYWYYRMHGWIAGGSFAGIWRRTVKKTVPSSISVICFIAMSKIMSGTGQTYVLAQGIAGVMGIVYTAFAPVVGVLGTFITSSNMASNILFGSFQATTAGLLGVSIPMLLGAQTAGGAIGSTIGPGSIILGSSTAGIAGQEGRVLRYVLPWTIALAVVVGILNYLLCVLLH